MEMETLPIFTDRVANREDTARALDRLRVLDARKHFRWWQLAWLLIGPGILVMLGENDAPSMLSYAATGSNFGIGFFLPFVLLTFVMAFITQEITVRLGAISKAGHAELIYRRFGHFWGNFAMIDLLFTNFLTLVTEFVGIVAGAGFFGVPSCVAVAGGILVITGAYSFRRYWSWERTLLALAMFNLIFIPVAVISHPNWGAVAHSFFTFSPLPSGLNAPTILILLSDIGATITPWMLFFQQSSVVDKGLSMHDINQGRMDTARARFWQPSLPSPPLLLRHHCLCITWTQVSSEQPSLHKPWFLTWGILAAPCSLWASWRPD